MSRDWLMAQRDKGAYLCPNPDEFLMHVSASGSRKKYWFLSRERNLLRVWMVLEGVDPVILAYTDFGNVEEMQTFVKEKLHDFTELVPLGMMLDKLV